MSLRDAFDPSVPIGRAWTPPSGWYTAREIFEIERRTVFRHSWQPAARLTQLASAGDYVAGCFAGEPYVVVRDHEGSLRAFYNTCRHKGREVVTGSGRAEQLVCGYHAWSYDLDGRLRKAPRMAGIEDFDRKAMGLPPLAVDSWGPWVMICRDDSAAPLSATATALSEELDAGGWTELAYAGARSWTIACNWKVYVDNYLDGGYHIPHMHPSLDAQLDMSGYRTELHARYSIQTCPPSDRSEGVRIGERAIYAWLYPNLMLNRYGDCLDMNHVVPIDENHCRVDYEFYFRDPKAEAVEASIAQSDFTQQEDIAICESVQRGLHSESYERGRYAPTVEIGEHHFHGLLARDYQVD